MKLVITSDWHLDWVTAGVSRFNELDHAIGEMCAPVIKQKVDLFLFTGDLCDPDTTRSHRAVAHAMNIKRMLHANGIDTAWIAGNHDVIEDGHGTTTLSALGKDYASGLVFEQPHFHVYKTFTLFALPFTARSHSYDPAEQIAEWAASEDFPRDLPVVIAGHLCIEGMGHGSETKDMPRGREVFFPVEACKEHFPDALLINGHYHEHQRFKPNKRDKQEIVIPGSLARLTMSERNNQPGWLYVEA